jgi:hypothetical protein
MKYIATPQRNATNPNIGALLHRLWHRRLACDLL